jgi:hypothetical protein
VSVAYNLPITLERWERMPSVEREIIVDELNELIDGINAANEPTKKPEE